MSGLSVGRASAVGAAMSALLVWQPTAVVAASRAGMPLQGANLGASAWVSTARPSAAAGSTAPAEGSRFVPVRPRRIMDTRTGAGGVRVGPAGARSTVSFPVAGVAGVPRSGTTAVLLHLTALHPAKRGALVAFPAGTRRPRIVSASFSAGGSATSMVLVQPGTAWGASVYNGSRGATHLRADVIGYYAWAAHAPAGSVQMYLTPWRIMDTRTGEGEVPVGPVRPRGTVSFPVADWGGVPRTGVTAVLLQLTTIRPKAAGALVGFPAGARRPGIVSASFSAGEKATATVLIRPGRGLKASVYNNSAGATHLRVDVVGYFAAPTDPPIGSELVPVDPRPILGTLSGAGGVQSRTVPAHSTVSFPVVGVAGVPSSRVTGVLVYLTGIRPTGSGTLRAFPAGSLHRPGFAPTAFTGGKDVTTTLLLPPGGAGRAAVYNGSRAEIHVRVDVVGYYRPIPAGWTSRVSVASSGTEANGSSEPTWYGPPSLSVDGRHVAFDSRATNLVRGDSNGERDVFVHDRVSGSTHRMSVAASGAEANGESFDPSISADGRYVAFSSAATDLVDGDTNDSADVFVHDRQTGSTSRVSVASDGTEADAGGATPSISADGRYVGFISRSSNLPPGGPVTYHGVFVHDRLSGATTRISVAGLEPVFSDDGQIVAFWSDHPNLVPNDTNQTGDVFVHDRLSGATTRVSVASDGTEAELHGGSIVRSLSADGRYVGFSSGASNLVPDDTNGVWDVFVHDRVSGATTRVNVASDGTEAEPWSNSHGGALSGEGRYVAFYSDATLVPGGVGPHAYVHDRHTATTSLVGVGTDGSVAEWGASGASISGDGRYAAFWSGSRNLVAGDTNYDTDVFIREWQ
jgi:Tol biopolymer transport system component